MAAFSFDGEVEPEHGGQQRAGADADGSLGNGRPDVAAQGIVHMGVVHHAGFDHRFCPAGPLFGRLEDKLDIAVDAVLEGIHCRGGGQHHGRVRVMAAGMHDAGMLGRKGSAGLLGDGQCIHVGPDQKCRAGAAGLQQPHHPVAGDARSNGKALASQVVGHVGAGLFFCVSDFRYAVQVPAGVDDEVFVRLDK